MRNGAAVERVYPRRYGGELIGRYLGAISARLGGAIRELSVDGELGADEAELILVDDLSLGARGTTGTPGTRADVVYVDEARGAVYLDGPLCGARYGDGGAAADLAPPLPLPVLLWRGRLSPGTWVLVTSRAGEGYERRLIRTTAEALERGRSLALDLEWCGVA